MLSVRARGASVIEPVGRQYRLIVLLAIALFCLGREVFFVATVGNTVKVRCFALPLRSALMVLCTAK